MSPGPIGPQPRPRSERLGDLVLSIILGLPLLADLIAEGLGFQVFYLADPKLQAVWGTLAQVGGGWPLYRDALAGRPTARLYAGGATLIWGVSLYSALFRPGFSLLFLASVTLIALYHLQALLAAKRQG